ncbi:MAG: hypothetical protein LUH53_04540 [Lachnospiraceae bacterium]|nr:hypothetical protein [Lachnospiraceae bacterium]
MTAPILELDHEKAARLQKELDTQRPLWELDHEKAARLQKELDAANEKIKTVAAENKALKNRLSRQKKRKKQ